MSHQSVACAQYCCLRACCGHALMLAWYKSLAAVTNARGASLADAVQRTSSGIRIWILRSTWRAVMKRLERKNRTEAEGTRDCLQTRRNRQTSPPGEVCWHPHLLVKLHLTAPHLGLLVCLHCRAHHQGHGFMFVSCFSDELSCRTDLKSAGVFAW